jgi:hypothetical protein
MSDSMGVLLLFLSGISYDGSADRHQEWTCYRCKIPWWMLIPMVRLYAAAINPTVTVIPRMLYRIKINTLYWPVHVCLIVSWWRYPMTTLARRGVVLSIIANCSCVKSNHRDQHSSRYLTAVTGSFLMTVCRTVIANALNKEFYPVSGERISTQTVRNWLHTSGLHVRKLVLPF